MNDPLTRAVQHEHTKLIDIQSLAKQEWDGNAKDVYALIPKNRKLKRASVHSWYDAPDGWRWQCDLRLLALPLPAALENVDFDYKRAFVEYARVLELPILGAEPAAPVQRIEEEITVIPWRNVHIFADSKQELWAKIVGYAAGLGDKEIPSDDPLDTRWYGLVGSQGV